MALTDKLSAIGAAIREKTGKADLLTLDQMPTEIASIQGGGDAIIKTVSGVCPITLENCAEGNLLDYKIYGAEGGVGDKNKNLFNPYTLIKGYSGQWSDGSLVANANGSISDYIDIEGASKVTATILTETNGGASHPLYFYDADKNYIQISDKLGLLTDKPGQRSKTFTVPEGAKYCRFYILTNYSKGNTVWAQIEVGDAFTGYVPYGYEVPIIVNDAVYTIPSIYPQLGADDYIDFENRKVVIGGISTMMELPKLLLIGGSNIFDVDTVVKPSNVELSYVKQVKFNIMKTVEGQVPLTVEGVGQRLEDYKIYGAEGGVGDKTKNLFSLNNVTGANVRVEKNDSYPGVEFLHFIDGGTALTITADFKENTQYVFTTLLHRYDGSTAKHVNIKWYYTDGTTSANYQLGKDTLKTMVSDEGKTVQKIATSSSYGTDAILDLSVTQLEEGTVATGFEPNGYKIPIKTNDKITEVYIGTEPLETDDYIDFENRTIRVGGVNTFVELPEIYLQNGTNVIDVDTSPKPSKVAVSFVDNDGGYDAGYASGYESMKLAIDMSDEMFRFNEKVTSYPGNWYRMNLNFTDANGVEYKQMATYTSSGKICIIYTTVSGSQVVAFNAANTPAWADEAYRTIHIIDGAMTGDVTTFGWLIKQGIFNPTE